MRKILSKPVVLEALESMALFHLEGRVISNPPKNEAPKATSMAKKRRLKMALVERSFKAEAPKMEVTMTPRDHVDDHNGETIGEGIARALRRSPLRLRKKLTVMGMMGHTQGVASAMRPPMNPSPKMTQRLWFK